MGEKKIIQLLELINEVVNEDSGVWKERRDAILAEASDGDKINLEEFAAWFGGT